MLPILDGDRGGARSGRSAGRGERSPDRGGQLQRLPPLAFNDPHFAFLPYGPFAAYGQSQTADVLFAVSATARWARDGITANAMMRGAVAAGPQRHTGGLRTLPERRRTPPPGAATPVLAAASPLLEGIGGRYFEDAAEAPRGVPPRG